MSNNQHADYDGITIPLALINNEVEMQKHLTDRYPDMFEEPNQETREAMQSALIFDFSKMRTHRLPEDDEGMDETNQIPSRMPKALRDLFNGVTPDNPQGVTQMVNVRLHNKLVDKLKAHGASKNKGYQTLIIDILEEYSESHNL